MVPACCAWSSMDNMGAMVGFFTASLLATHSLDDPAGPSPTMTVGLSIKPRRLGS